MSAGADKADSDPLDLAIVGAGPCGLAAAVAAKERGLTHAVFDRGCITESLTHYPYYMTFFSTAERLEIGGVPFTIPEAKPTRQQALAYYRRVVGHHGLNVRQYEEVTAIGRRTGGEFVLHTHGSQVGDASCCDRIGEPMTPSIDIARPWARSASGTLLLVILIPAACADPPVDLPPSSPFPYNVQLGMTFQDLRLARSGIWLEPDSGWVLEEHTRGQYQYELTGDQWPPARQSKLIYVHRIDEELSGDYAADRWETIADSMAVDLGAEPGCATLAHGRLFWRRAMFREPDGRLEAAVELQITTIGDAGPGLATLTTRIWLAEYAAPVARFLEAPQATARGQLPDWGPCEEPAAMEPRM